MLKQKSFWFEGVRDQICIKITQNKLVYFFLVSYIIDSDGVKTLLSVITIMTHYTKAPKYLMRKLKS